MFTNNLYGVRKKNRKFCAYRNGTCGNRKMIYGKYCDIHKCLVSKCRNCISSDVLYCQSHICHKCYQMFTPHKEQYCESCLHKILNNN